MTTAGAEVNLEAFATLVVASLVVDFCSLSEDQIILLFGIEDSDFHVAVCEPCDAPIASEMLLKFSLDVADDLLLCLFEQGFGTLHRCFCLSLCRSTFRSQVVVLSSIFDGCIPFSNLQEFFHLLNSDLELVFFPAFCLFLELPSVNKCLKVFLLLSLHFCDKVAEGVDFFQKGLFACHNLFSLKGLSCFFIVVLSTLHYLEHAS